MKKTFFIIALAISVMSCNNNKAGNGDDTDSIVYNDTIQGVFFDTPFGATKEELLQKFEEHSFYPDDNLKTNDWIPFDHYENRSCNNKSKCYSFGGFNWQHIDVSFANNQFYRIRFYNANKDKAESIKDYENILNSVSKKYKMKECESQDTTIYRKAQGVSRSGRKVTVSCYRYESIGKDIFIGVKLSYYEPKYDKVSDEL